MSKKIVLMILVIFAGFSLSSCSLAIEDEPVIDNPMEDIHNEPRLRGYVLSFRSLDDSINIDLGLDSSNPFMIYEHHYKLSNHDVVEYIQGNAIMNVKYHENIVEQARSTKVETEIILNHKFIHSILDVKQVVYDPETDQLSLKEYTYGHMLSSVNSGLKIGVKNEIKENDLIIYSFEFELKVTFVDELLSVKALEYDINNTLLKETVYSDLNDYILETMDDTDYVMVEEEYKKANNEIYKKRTIYSRGEVYNNIKYIQLMFTNEIGYVENNKSIKLIFT